MRLPGTKNGLILLGPRALSAVTFLSMLGNPPMPEPSNTPNLSGSKLLSKAPESSKAILDAAMPNKMKRSIFFTSFSSNQVSGSNT
ncbi:hypothetical protein ANAPH2_01037 [Anaplasma phagocytophilum]|nr:hypothetical protein ANAPH2_01037 [Anaplasma phagocytophilum]